MEQLKSSVSARRTLGINLIQAKAAKSKHIPPIDFKLGKNIGIIKRKISPDDCSDVREMLSMISPEITQINSRNRLNDTCMCYSNSPCNKNLKSYVCTSIRENRGYLGNVNTTFSPNKVKPENTALKFSPDSGVKFSENFVIRRKSKRK